jgi:hypothetical protein
LRQAAILSAPEIAPAFPAFRPSMARAGKCSCISGISAIHGLAPENASCISGMPAIPGLAPENAPAFPASRPSLASKKKPRLRGV